MTATLSLIVAMSENSVIGRDGDMPWRLSADLKRFKQLTMGHPLIMGRRTYESIGRLLPGRSTIILTRNADYQVPGARMAADLDTALTLADDEQEIFIVGGGEIYRLALPRVERMYVTRVHVALPGDTTFPQVDWDAWTATQVCNHPADDRNQYAHTFTEYHRKPR